ncbi:MAG: inositol-3-phosphate synthase [Candidatus Nezhaarchaeota archaeon]|nr:inositol-3-phosphate synthase [Candidatus Nezhaarchaeota archaeon]MCX8142181.1 inositol-3-phosphate synthase [Candidatus Nezhaarchaeota archaeon]MDW8050036.1 inositol-3-phosphate synthase [Nitrososphaerota archaeon]
MGNVRVALIGVGNCASALVQGVYYYRSVDDDAEVPGLLHTKLGGYHVGDIEFVAAFDVSVEKIGKDLSEAIFAYPNITGRFADVPKLGVEVKPGPVLDGVAPHMVDCFKPHSMDVSLDYVVDEIKGSGAEVVVNLLPVGSEEATRFYAEATVEAGAAFVNGIPVFIASDPSGYWPNRYREARLPLLGDDIKGQLGATILHTALVSLFRDRGVKILETYQLNIGGNTDFLNMTVEDRLKSKRISKTRAVTSIVPEGFDLESSGCVRIGPSDYVPFLGNTKVCYIYIRGLSFANFGVELDVKLKVDDKSMFAGAMIDVIRLAKVAMDRGLNGPIPEICAYYFKHPPKHAPSPQVALQWLKSFLGEELEVMEGSTAISYLAP